MPQQRSKAQCEFLLKFMETHPNFAKSYYLGAKAQQNKLWKDLALNLNANGPPIKDVSSWKECWWNWRNDIKMRIAENRCSSGNFQRHFLSPIEHQIAIVCDIFSEVDYRIPNAKAFGLPDSESRLEPLRTSSPTGSRLSTTELTSKRKSRFQEKIQKEEKDETKNVEHITVQSEGINVNLEVIPDTFSNYSHASSSYTISTLSPISEVPSETKRKRSQSKEIHHNEQVHDTNNLKCIANEIKEINVTLENHTKQLKNINTTLEEMCSLKKQEFEETKRHHLALERIAMEKVKQKLNRNFTKNNTIA